MHAAAPAARLSRAVLGYLTLMIAIVTLAPFQFAAAALHGLSPVFQPRDLVLNIVLFIPFGFTWQLGRVRGTAAAWGRAAALGGALSLVIETAQLFAPGRFPSIADVATNTLGAALGALVAARATRAVAGATTLRAMALDLPLIGLTYLLVPILLLGGLSSAPGESALLLLPTMSAAWIIASVHAEYRVAGAEPRAGTLPFTAMGAALVIGVGLLPAVPYAPEAAPAAVIVFAIVARLRRTAPPWLTHEPLSDGSPVRRFESATLGVAIIPLVVFAILHALWPLNTPAVPWRGTFALFPSDLAVSVRAIFRVMAQVSTFTALGYALAEHAGRTTVAAPRLVRRALAWALALAFPLELLRGARAATIASAPVFAVCVVASGFGAWLFVLQLRNVRALLGRGDPVAPPVARRGTARGDR